MLDILIKDALTVFPDKEAVSDVGIKEGKIAYIREASEDIRQEAVHTIDAKGKILFPGGIEAHAHIFEPMHKGWTEGRDEWLPDTEGVTAAALYGGTTTVASFAFMDVHSKEKYYDVAKAVESRRIVFEGHSFTHYIFHPVLTGKPSLATIESIADAVKEGTTSFKVFTTDVTSKQTGIRIETGHLLEAMKKTAECGAILMVHAEDDELVRYMEARLKAEKNDQAYNLNLVHSALSEAISFNKVLKLAKEAGSSTFFAHVTSRSGIEEMHEAKIHGQAVFGEVLHNYLLFSNEDYHKPEGIRFHTYPAMKDRKDKDALWEALSEDVINMVSTDEYTTPYSTKIGGQTIETACGGHNGIETRGIVTFSEGVSKGRFDRIRFSNVFSTNPAKILGLYPQKGLIREGSDADFVIWDPNDKRTISLSDLHQPSDYSIYEGLNVIGWPSMVIIGGVIAVENEEIKTGPKSGKFIKRKMDRKVMEGIL